jgi:histidyl-tRNA synthetase
MARKPKIKKVKTKKVRRVREKIVTPKEEKVKGPQTLKGMKDILPAEQKYWEYVGGKATEFARSYGFARIDVPVLEEKNLFVRAVGAQTDIVEKEMFTFVTPGGESVCLRPEATASIARAYIQHGMFTLPQPVKLYYFGPMYRHERPQAGRLRQFYQFGFEILGDKHPVVDAELIMLAYNFYREIGLDIEIQINSIGCSSCRNAYKKELINYYQSKKKLICETCKKRLVRNPLRLLDCKEEKCLIVKEEAPHIVDWLCEECRNHFVKVLEYLDEANVPYNLNPYLVRGLDYYTRTVFEIFVSGEEGRQDALAGGGRYDYLVELLGGRPTPACGFALGLERTILKIKEKGIVVPEIPKPKIFLAQLGEQARQKSLLLFEELHKAGIFAASSFSKDGLKPQLEEANKLGVRYALILGQKEIVDGTIIIRDMESGIQEIVDFNKIIPEIKKKLETSQKFEKNEKLI